MTALPTMSHSAISIPTASHQRDVRPTRVAAAVDVAPERLDPKRIGAHHVALEHVLDHRDDRFGRKARRIDLADALDSAGGLELEEQEIAPAESGRRVADDEGLEFGDFHAQRAFQNTITFRSAAPERDEATASLILSNGYRPVTSSSSEASLPVQRDSPLHIDRPAGPSPSSSRLPLPVGGDPAGIDGRRDA